MWQRRKEIVAYAHERNVTVEAEIGHVGEGDSYHVEGNTMLTTPEEAKKFVEQTGVDYPCSIYWNSSWRIQRNSTSEF